MKLILLALLLAGCGETFIPPEPEQEPRDAGCPYGPFRYEDGGYYYPAEYGPDGGRVPPLTCLRLVSDTDAGCVQTQPSYYDDGGIYYPIVYGADGGRILPRSCLTVVGGDR